MPSERRNKLDFIAILPSSKGSAFGWSPSAGLDRRRESQIALLPPAAAHHRGECANVAVARAVLPPLSLSMKLGDFQQTYRADFGRGRVQQVINQCRFVVSYYEQRFRHSHSHSCRRQGAMTVLDVCLTLLFSIFLILYAAVGSTASLTDRQRCDLCLRG